MARVAVVGGTSAGEGERAAEERSVVDPTTAEGRRAAALQTSLGLRARGDAVAGQRLCTGTQVEEGRRTQGTSCEEFDQLIYNILPPTPQPFYGPFSGTTRLSRCQRRSSGLLQPRVQCPLARAVDRPHSAATPLAIVNQLPLPRL